jgi:hypothetical protein
MDLGSRWWGQADENYDAVSAWIHAVGVNVEIGFPVVNRPKVARLIYVDIGHTHHWDKAGRPWWVAVTVQWRAVM